MIEMIIVMMAIKIMMTINKYTSLIVAYKKKLPVKVHGFSRESSGNSSSCSSYQCRSCSRDKR